MKHLLVTMAALVLAALVVISVNWGPDTASAQSFSVVAAGQNQTCALTSSGGAVWCWGRNVEGELGIGTTAAPYTQTTVRVPVCASGVWNGTTCSGGATLSGVYAISAGPVATQSCATIIYLIIECWGFNSDGQVGNSSANSFVVNPVYVPCQGGSGSYCDNAPHILAGIVGMAAGGRHTCALDYTGYVWCWGHNAKGELGDGTTLGHAVATRVCATGSGQDCPNGTLLSGVAAIAAGQDFTCALLTSGGMKCWGFNHDGQLGDGTTTDRSLPVSVSGLTSGVASIAVGQSHSCAALTGGSVKCWGINAYGTLGDGTLVSKTTPTAVCASAPTACSGSLSGVSKLTSGAGHTCVVTTTSSVKCWGSNGFGQLGSGGSLSYDAVSTLPVDWALPTNPSWTPQVSALSGGGGHTCAIISSFVECWGWNGFGQLGNGTSSGFLDATTTWTGQDTDKDGCTDAQELGPNHVYGGQRDPTNFWDFFDTPNDTRTTLSTAMTATSPTLPAWVSAGSITGFPTASAQAPITLYIDNEKFQYDSQQNTQQNPNQFHIIARALNGTTATSHSSGSNTVVSNWRDKIVNTADYNRISARYYTDGDATIDPLSPPAATGYHPAFDRTDDPNSTEAWDLLGPDGHILLSDLAALNYQLNDHCN